MKRLMGHYRMWLGVASLVCVLAAPAAAGASVSFSSTSYPLTTPKAANEQLGAVAIVDLNNDNRGDIVAYRIGAVSPGEVIVFINQGDGTFGQAHEYDTCGSTDAGPMVVGQFSADHAADVIVGCTGTTSGVEELLGNGDGTLAAPQAYAAGAGPASFLALWPADDGGFPNVLYDHVGSNLLCYRPANNLTDQVCPPDTSNSDVQGNPSGFPQIYIPPTTAHFYSNDNCPRDDLIVSTSATAVRFWGENPFGSTGVAPCASLAYTPRDLSLPAGVGVSGAVAADVNLDGTPDLVMRGGNSTNDTLVTLPWLNGDGTLNGGFPPGEQPVLTSSIASIDQHEIADFDGDGMPDVAVEGETAADQVNNQSGTLAIHRGRGDGSFDSPPVTFAVPNPDGRNFFAVGDLNGDGKPDVASIASFSDSLTVLLNGSVAPTATPAPSGSNSSSDSPVTPAPSATPPDKTAPALTAVGLTAKKFAVGPAATALNASAKLGTKLRFTLSEAARVSIAITRQDRGRRKGSTCVKPSPRLRRAKSCTRSTLKGTLTRRGRPGSNTVPFSGRIGRKALAAGTYTFTLTAVDAAGNKSKRVDVSFVIVRR